MFKSIRAKLIASFSLLAILVTAMSAFSIYTTQKSGDDFRTYQDIATNSALASNIQSNMLMMRLGVFKYLSDPSDRFLTKFNTNFANTMALVKEAQTSIHEPDRTKWIAEIHDKLDLYHDGFKQVQALTLQSNRIINDTLNVHGKRVEEQLTQIKRSAREDGITEVSFLAAESLRTLLLGRINSVKFVQTHHQDDLNQAFAEFSALRSYLTELQTIVQSPERMTLLNDTLSQLDSYTQGVETLNTTIQKRDALVKDSLNVIGPNISKLSERIKNSVREEQDHIGPAVQRLNNVSVDTMITVAILILIISIGVGYFIPHVISKGLKDIQTKLAGIVATGDFSIRANESRSDEIGEMGRTVNLVLQTTQNALSQANSVVNAISKGQFDQRIDLELKGDLLTLKDGINRSADAIDQTMIELSHVIQSLNDGKFDITIHNRAQGQFKVMFDHFSESLNVMNRIFVDINGVMDAMQHGQFDRRIQVQAKGELAHLKDSINSSMQALEGAIKAIIAVMVAQSKGDLTQSVHAELQGDLKTLKDAINTSSTKLSDVVSRAIMSSKIVNEAASEVSLGSMNLSQRVQEQAAAIEETSATMEEMNSTVQNNTSHAQEATHVAHDVQTKSVNGSKVMNQTIDAMSAIQDSSHKISEIVTLIDAIAFQTNLLALNAAVEAARAGDHGRGFAVVAGEVRSLAQKSADAAKQITALINENVTRIDEGTRLASESGDVLNSINDSIHEVVNMIEHIAKASEQQMEGIEQVHKAITQIDDVTQQNAALVEETASAADSLTEQSESLQSDMAFFNTQSTQQKNTLPGLPKNSALDPNEQPMFALSRKA